MKDLQDLAIKKLNAKGITILEMAKLVQKNKNFLQNKISINQAVNAIKYVISKRETINAILTAIAIDKAAQNNLLDREIQKLINQDSPLYGIDEILALSIVNMFGSIALTNFGYYDKIKPGIIGRIDRIGKKNKYCTTFLDDIVSAIIASACSNIAHSLNQ